jgi:putative ABC transport system ATP-binding protein
VSELQLLNVAKEYRGRKTLVQALDGVSLTIGSGEFVSIVGRSGSGKTTLLDVLGLLLRPTGGSLLLDGVDTGTLSDGRRADLRSRSIGFVFQEYNLLSSLNVVENVMLPLRYARRNGHDGRSWALELLERAGLSDRRRHRPDELSGGEQQRVAIARALINRPSIVLADEPTGAVDSQTGRTIVDLLARLNADEGVTVIIVTHDLELASQTRRQIRLRDGHVGADEPNPQRLVSVPGTFPGEHLDLRPSSSLA